MFLKKYKFKLEKKACGKIHTTVLIFNYGGEEE